MATDPTKVRIEFEGDQASLNKVVAEAQQAIAPTSAAADKKAEEASRRRLQAIQRENQALELQLRLLKEVGQVGGVSSAFATTRGRASGRAIRAGVLSADDSTQAALLQRADLETRVATLQRQIRSREQQLRSGSYNLFGTAAYAERSRGRQVRSGFYNLFGSTAPAERLMGRAGLDFDGLSAAAKRAGLSVQDFVRKKSQATSVERLNAQQLRTLTKETDAMERSTKRSTTGFTQMGRVLRSLLTAFVGFQVFRGLQRGLQELIQYQVTLQNVKLGVAEVLLIGSRVQNRLTGAVLPIGQQIEQAFSLATRASKELVQKSIDVGLPVETLVRAFQTVGGIAQKNGVQFKDTLDIITQISVVAQRLNIPFNQLTRSIDNVFTGLRVQQTQLGVILGLNQKMVEEQIQQGTLGQFLLERLQGVAATLPKNLQTFEGIRQSIRSIVQDLSQRVLGGMFQEFQGALSGLRERLNDLRKPENAAILRHYAREATEFAKSLERTTLALTGLVRKYQDLLKVLVALSVGRRLGGLAGPAIAGGGYAIGAFGAGAAGALAAPALFGAARGVTKFGIELARQGVGAGVADVATAASRAFPERAAVLASAAGVASLKLTLMTAGITAVIGALGFLSYALYRIGRARGLRGALRFAGDIVGQRYGAAARTAREVLFEEPEDIADRREVARLGVETRRALVFGRSFFNRTTNQTNVQSDIYRNFGGTGEPPFVQTFRRLNSSPRAADKKRASDLYDRYLLLAGEGGPLARGEDAARLVGNTEAANEIATVRAAIQNLLTSIVPASTTDAVLSRIDAALKDQSKIVDARKRELGLQQQLNAIDAERLNADIERIRLKQRQLEEQDRGRRLDLELSQAEQDLQFAQTRGRARAGAESNITRIQSRLGLIEQGIQYAQSIGNQPAVVALDQQRIALEKQLLEEKKTIAQVEIDQSQKGIDQTAERIAQERDYLKKDLPQRLVIEKQILALQERQAAVKAAGAKKEIELAEQQLTGGTIAGQRLPGLNERLAEIQRQKALANAAGDTTFFSELEKRELDVTGRIYQAQTDIVRARGELAASEAQQGIARQGVSLVELKYANDITEKKKEIVGLETQGVDLENEKGNKAAAYNALQDESAEQILRQIARSRELLEVNTQLVGTMKDFVAQLLRGEDASKALKNAINQIAQFKSEEIANALVNGIRGVLGGYQTVGGAGKDVLGAIFGQGSAGRRGGGGGGGGGGVNVGDIAGKVQQYGGTIKKAYDVYKATGSFSGALKSVFGGAGGGGGGGGGGFLGGLFGGGGAGAGAATGEAAAGVSTNQSSIFGIGAFGGGGGAGASGAGAGAGAGAGGYLAAAYAVYLAAQGAQDYYKKNRLSLTQPDREQFAEKTQREAINNVFKGFGLGFLGKLLDKALGRTGVLKAISLPGYTGSLADFRKNQASAGGIAAWLLNPLGAIFAQFFQPKTAGPIIQSALKPYLTAAGLTQDIRFGTGRGKVASGPNTILYPITYSPETLQAARQFGIPAGTAIGGLARREDVRKGLPGAATTAVLAAATGLRLSEEDAIELVKRFTGTTTKDFQTGSFQILRATRKVHGPLSLKDAASQIAALAAIFQDLPPIIDQAALALVAFNDKGQVGLKRLERIGQDAKAVLAQGLPNALVDAVKTGQPQRAAEDLAQSFTDTFLNRVAERLTQNGAIGKALTDAVSLASQAAELLAKGDTAGANKLLAQARTSFIAGRNVFQGTVNQLYPSLVGFQNSLGVFTSGGLINSTGAGLPGFQTPAAVRVPGPVGQPRLAVVHGDEVIREGAHNDALVGAMENVAQAQRELIALLSRRLTNTGQPVVVQIGTDVIASTQAKVERRDAVGLGIRTPNSSLGIG